MVDRNRADHLMKKTNASRISNLLFLTVRSVRDLDSMDLNGDGVMDEHELAVHLDARDVDEIMSGYDDDGETGEIELYSVEYCYCYYCGLSVENN